jgi:hypothetical protein
MRRSRVARISGRIRGISHCACGPRGATAFWTAPIQWLQSAHGHHTPRHARPQSAGEYLLGVITMRNRISIIALVLSIASLGYAGWLQYRMDTALQRRERELVRHWAPQMRSVYADMIAGTNAMPADPQTLDELFAPLFRLIGQIGDGGEPGSQKGKAK